MEWFQIVGSRWLCDNFTFTKELQQRYGLTKTKPTGVIRPFVCYDVLNHYVLDGVLSTKQIGESVLALNI